LDCDQAIAKSEFADIAGQIAERDGCSKAEAYQKARIEHPELYSDLNGCDAPVAKRTKDGIRVELDGCVAAIMKLEGVDSTTALRLARQRYPELIDRVQKGIKPPPRELAGMPGEKVPGETAKANWFAAIAAVQDRNKGMTYTQAMSEARKSNPDLFQAYQHIGGEQVSGSSV
jgi:hypothetical protein